MVTCPGTITNLWNWNPINSPAGKREFFELANKLIPTKQPEFTSGIDGSLAPCIAHPKIRFVWFAAWWAAEPWREFDSEQVLRRQSSQSGFWGAMQGAKLHQCLIVNIGLFSWDSLFASSKNSRFPLEMMGFQFHKFVIVPWTTYHQPQPPFTKLQWTLCSGRVTPLFRVMFSGHQNFPETFRCASIQPASHICANTAHEYNTPNPLPES